MLRPTIIKDTIWMNGKLKVHVSLVHSIQIILRTHSKSKQQAEQQRIKKTSGTICNCEGARRNNWNINHKSTIYMTFLT